MVRRTAGNYVDLINRLHFIVRKVYGIKVNCTVRNNRVDSVADNLGLLVNFLKHKMLIAALFSGLSVPFYLNKRLLDDLAVDVVEGNGALFELCYLHIADVVNLTGIFQNSRNVRCNIALTVGDTDYHGAVLASAVDLAGEVLEHNAERIRTADTNHSSCDSVRGTKIVLLIVVVNEFNGYLCIGLRLELVALLDKLLALLLIVLDDTVVNADNVAVVRTVG